MGNMTGVPQNVEYVFRVPSMKKLKITGLEELRKITTNLRQNSQLSGPDSNRVLPEYKSDMLPLRQPALFKRVKSGLFKK
jgi:hypothetical protein